MSENRSADPCVSCIVPALNECENLKVLLPRLAGLLESLCSAWEIIVVDDGSSDGTAELISVFSIQPGYRYLQLSRNFGKEAALSAGLEAAGGDVIVCLDADLQHPIELIPVMLGRWRQGIDVVYAVRESRSDESWLKRLGTKLFYAILGSNRRFRIPEDAGDFRLMDRLVVNALITLPERTRFMKGLYAWVGFKAESMPYEPAERLHGKSNFNLLRLAGFAFDGITAFSTWPLRMLSVIGVLIAVAAFVYGIYLIEEYFFDDNVVSGWTTIVTGMFFFAGVNMIAFGIIGTYIARIFDEVKQRPLYLVRRHLGRPCEKRKHAPLSGETEEAS